MTTTPLVEVKSEIGIGERNAVGVNHVASVNEFVVVTNELASSEPSFPQQQRPRANSSIESADVQSVVAKAKRASSLLWMILHAKVCHFCVPVALVVENLFLTQASFCVTVLSIRRQ